MNNKQLAMAAAAVALLVALLLSSRQGEVAVNQLGDTMVELAAVQGDQAMALSIASAKGTNIEFKKVGAQWQLASGHAADGKRIQSLLDELSKLQAERRRVNLDDLKPYGLEPGSKRTLLRVLGSAGPLATIALGKSGPDYGSAWTQREGKNEVLLLPEGPVGRLASAELKPERWIERQPVQLDAATIASVKLDGETVLEASKSGDKDWGDAPADKVDALISKIKGLYIEGPSDKPTTPPLLSISLGSGTETIALGLHQNGETWTASLHGLGYKLSKHAAEGLREAAGAVAGQERKN